MNKVYPIRFDPDKWVLCAADGSVIARGREALLHGRSEFKRQSAKLSQKPMRSDGSDGNVMGKDQ